MNKLGDFLNNNDWDSYYNSEEYKRIKEKLEEERKLKVREMICDAVHIPPIHAQKIIHRNYEKTQIIKEILKHDFNKKKWLLILGDVGVGKSFALSLLLFTLTPKIGLYVRYAHASELEDIDYKYYKVLGIDDIGLESDKNLLSRIIHHYYDNFKILIMTSNLNMEKIIENYDARIVDRIIELSEIIEITGKSRRSSGA